MNNLPNYLLEKGTHNAQSPVIGALKDDTRKLLLAIDTFPVIALLDKSLFDAKRIKIPIMI